MPPHDCDGSCVSLPCCVVNKRWSKLGTPSLNPREWLLTYEAAVLGSRNKNKTNCSAWSSRIIDISLFGLLNLHFEPLLGRRAESPSTVSREDL